MPQAGSHILSSGVGPAGAPSYREYGGGAKLTVMPGSGQFAQHVFIKVALHVQVFDIMLVEFIQARDDLLQNLGVGIKNKASLHVTGEGRCIFPIHGFYKWKNLRADNIINLARILGFKFAPAHGLPFFILGKYFGEGFHR